MWQRRSSGCLNLRYQTCHGESHISKCQSLLNHKEEVTWIISEVLIIYCEDPLLPAQGKIVEVKIMLIPSSLDKDENDTKKNQVDKLKFILICFISLMSICHHTIKRNATWWSWQNQSAQNPDRFYEWCKETKFPECAEICHTGQTGIEHRSDWLDLSKSKSSPPDLFGPFTGFQSRLPDMTDIGLD
jgi:hypothetical protein